MNRPASLVTSVFLLILALAQFCRVIFRITVIAAGIEIPVWSSAVAAIVLASLAFWLLKERRSKAS